MSVSLANRAPSFLVVRAAVDERDDYDEYLPELRFDFWFSCAYCTICETEAQGVGFSIDQPGGEVMGGVCIECGNDSGTNAEDCMGPL